MLMGYKTFYSLFFQRRALISRAASNTRHRVTQLSAVLGRCGSPQGKEKSTVNSLDVEHFLLRTRNKDKRNPSYTDRKIKIYQTEISVILRFKTLQELST